MSRVTRGSLVVMESCSKGAGGSLRPSQLLSLSAKIGLGVYLLLEVGAFPSLSVLPVCTGGQGWGGCFHCLSCRLFLFHSPSRLQWLQQLLEVLWGSAPACPPVLGLGLLTPKRVFFWNGWELLTAATIWAFCLFLWIFSCFLYCIPVITDREGHVVQKLTGPTAHFCNYLHISGTSW